MGPLGWDTHQQNFPTIKNTLAPPLDKGVSALLADLKGSGLLDDTLVIMMGEFGRTPKINGNAGRDHHGRANCALLAGAGMPRGLVLGRTDAKADSPADRPVTPADLAADALLGPRDRPHLSVRDPRRPPDPAGGRGEGAKRTDLRLPASSLVATWDGAAYDRGVRFVRFPESSAQPWTREGAMRVGNQLSAVLVGVAITALLAWGGFDRPTSADQPDDAAKPQRPGRREPAPRSGARRC